MSDTHAVGRVTAPTWHPTPVRWSFTYEADSDRYQFCRSGSRCSWTRVSYTYADACSLIEYLNTREVA